MKNENNQTLEAQWIKLDRRGPDEITKHKKPRIKRYDTKLDKGGEQLHFAQVFIRYNGLLSLQSFLFSEDFLQSICAIDWAKRDNLPDTPLLTSVIISGQCSRPLVT